MYDFLNRNKPEESGQMHTQEQERTQKDVENEDLLINQIDEFREKAKQLQVLLEAKESKAAELQSLVDESRQSTGVRTYFNRTSGRGGQDRY